MKFLIDLACDLARDLAVVTLALAVVCAAGWVLFGRQYPEGESKTVPARLSGQSSEKDASTI